MIPGADQYVKRVERRCSKMLAVDSGKGPWWWSFDDQRSLADLLSGREIQEESPYWNLWQTVLQDLQAENQDE